MMTHTRAPWTHDADDKKVNMFRIRDAEGELVAEVVGAFDDDSQDRANTKLIAAAPELLAELKGLHRAYVNLLEVGRDRITTLGGDCDPVDKMEGDDPNLRAVRALLAKIEG